MRTRRWCYIKRMIAGRIERLEEMIALHEEIAGEEAIELADAASFDPGPEAERLRRFQAAKSRELRQTLELFLKMQAARDKRKTFTTEGTEGTEGRGKTESGMRERSQFREPDEDYGVGGTGKGTVDRSERSRIRSRRSRRRRTRKGRRAAGLGTRRGVGVGRAGSAGGPAKGGRFPAGRESRRGERWAVRRRGVEGKKRPRAKPISR